MITVQQAGAQGAFDTLSSTLSMPFFLLDHIFHSQLEVKHAGRSSEEAVKVGTLSAGALTVTWLVFVCF